MSHRVVLSDGSLFFLRVSSSRRGADGDEGTYWCLASNSQGTTRSRNATLTIAALGSHFQALPDADVSVRLGEQVTLPCRPPKGTPEPQVSWQKDGVDVHNSSRSVVSLDGDLRISQAAQEDSGSYVCRAANAAGQRNSPPATITVLGKFKLIIDPHCPR